MLNGSIDVFVGVASYQGKVLFEAVQAEACEDYLVVVEEDVLRTETAVNDIIIMKLLNAFSYAKGQFQALRLPLNICNLHIQIHFIIPLKKVHNILLTEIVKLRKMPEIELCPLCDFILYILKDIARNLVLGYSNQIIFTFQVAYFRDPDRVRLSLLQFSHIQEVFQLHFFVAPRGWLEGILELIDDRLLLT